MSLRTVAIIPARGGSKQIPRKNLVNFCGKPLLAWSILQAKASKYVDNVYVTSDCDEILACASQFGAIPLKRPAHLATDTASSEDALIDALLQIEQQTSKTYPFFVFLQATSPLREPLDIDLCIEKRAETGANTVFSAVATGDLCAWQRKEQGLQPVTYTSGVRLPRQKNDPLYIENGSIYVCDWEGMITHKNRMVGKIEICVFPSWKVYEIDEHENLIVCGALFNHHRLGATCTKAALGTFQPMLMVYDFDGVMTNNLAIVHQDGTESVAVNRADGWGIAQLKRVGIKQLILSTEENSVVAARAKKLQLDVLHGCKDKKSALVAYCAKHQIPLQQTLYVGNDVNDLAVLKSTGYSVCPSDAHPEILAIADYVTKAKGGEGVIREISDLMLKDLEGARCPSLLSQKSESTIMAI